VRAQEHGIRSGEGFRIRFHLPAGFRMFRRFVIVAAMIAAFSGCGGRGSHAVPTGAAGTQASGSKLSLAVPPPPPNLAMPPRAAVLQTAPAAPDRSGRRSPKTTAGHPAFFAGEVALSNGVYYLQFANGTVFGYYSYLADPRYIYHFDLGYEYVADANDGKSSVYLYDFASSHWWYTSPTFAFPYVYDFSLNAFLYYYPDTSNAGHYTTSPRYFYNFAIGQIITLPGAHLVPSKLTFAGGSTSAQGVAAYPPGGDPYHGAAATVDPSACSGIATASSTSPSGFDSIVVTPGQPGSCSMIVIDASGGRTPLPILVTTPPMGSITEFPHGGGSSQQNLAADSSGNLWSTSVFTDQIVKRTPSGTESVFALPAKARPECIRSGSDGNMWFAEFGTNQIGSITPAGIITQFSLPIANSKPSCIVQGPDGAFWFTEAGHAAIGRITTAGVFTEYPTPAATSNEVSGITVGPDGNIWFTDYPANKIGRITPAGVLTEFPIPLSNAGPSDIAAGPDGALWFTEIDAGLIARVTVTGTFTQYARPSTYYDQPNTIIAGPDGNLWFTDFNGAKIGRITPSGIVDEFPTLHRNTFPGGIAVGPDGALWFTQAGSGAIGRIHP
jgi:streptogramin lyase